MSAPVHFFTHRIIIHVVIIRIINVGLKLILFFRALKNITINKRTEVLKAYNRIKVYNIRTTNMNDTLHVGHLIERHVNTVSGITISELARRLNCSRRNVYRIFDRQSIDSALLIRLCKILEHDFFHDISINLTLSDNVNQQDTCEPIRHT